MRISYFILVFALSINVVFGQRIEHVVIIGVDGMSPDGIQKAETPNMDKLMQNGAYTFHARDVLPSSSSQN